MQVKLRKHGRRRQMSFRWDVEWYCGRGRLQRIWTCQWLSEVPILSFNCKSSAYNVDQSLLFVGEVVNRVMIGHCLAGQEAFLRLSQTRISIGEGYIELSFREFYYSFDSF